MARQAPPQPLDCPSPLACESLSRSPGKGARLTPWAEETKLKVQGAQSSQRAQEGVPERAAQKDICGNLNKACSSTQLNTDGACVGRKSRGHRRSRQRRQKCQVLTQGQTERLHHSQADSAESTQEALPQQWEMTKPHLSPVPVLPNKS